MKVVLRRFRNPETGRYIYFLDTPKRGKKGVLGVYEIRGIKGISVEEMLDLL